MRRWWKGAWLFIFVSMCWVFAVPAQGVNGPKIIIQERVFDFKEAKEGSIIQHSFQVRNEGDQPLQINDVRPG